eukprot:1167764-Pleurochrysis_carterae.AAC.1
MKLSTATSVHAISPAASTLQSTASAMSLSLKPTRAEAGGLLTSNVCCRSPALLLPSHLWVRHARAKAHAGKRGAAARSRRDGNLAPISTHRCRSEERGHVAHRAPIQRGVGLAHRATVISSASVRLSV